MWFAVDDAGQRISAGVGVPGGTYTCVWRQPAVHTLIYRRASLERSCHFAHLPHSGCPWSSSVAVVRRDLVASITRSMPGCRVEHPRAGSAMRINGRFHIEMVTEPMTVAEWRDLARHYNERGDPVLFLWDLALLGAVSFQELETAYDPTLIESMRVCQHHSYSRLYIADRAGEMRGCRLFKVQGTTYRMTVSAVLRWERPALGAWDFKEGFRHPLSQPLWHLYPEDATRARAWEQPPIPLVSAPPRPSAPPAATAATAATAPTGPLTAPLTAPLAAVPVPVAPETVPASAVPAFFKD